MKNEHLKLILWALCFIPVSIFGQNLSKQQARTIAEDFFASMPETRSTDGAKENVITEAYTAETSGKNCFYVFNRGTNNGYVIVAADERIADPVVGYSDSGAIDYDNMPDNVKAWMEIMKVSLTNYAQKAATATRASSVSYDNPVDPLMKTKWGQGEPYNLMCPTNSNGKHYVTGCVITAMAQVMYYHQWPNQGTGSHSYEWNGQTLSADFSQSTYRWDLMLPEYNDNSSEESRNAVALLMKDCGIAVEAGYGGLVGTGAFEDMAAYALVANFDYDKSMRRLDRNFCSAIDYEQIFTSELRNGRPILIAGQPKVGSGHAFVIDGFNSAGYYHVNYGWTGSCNGFYKLGAFGYDINMTIYHNIKRNEGGNFVVTFGSSRDFLYEDGSLKCKYLYYSEVTNEGYQYANVALAIENVATHEIIYDDKKKADIWEENAFTITSALQDGNYIVYPVGTYSNSATSEGNGSSSWEKFYFYDNCQTYVDLKVENGVMTFANNNIVNELDEGKVEIDSICYILNDDNLTATVTYRNDRYGSYQGDVVIPKSVTYENKTYIVNSIGESACRECKKLNSMEIPDNVETIEGEAFILSNIKEFKIPEGSKLKSIGGWGFKECHQLKSIELPEGFTTTSDCVFQNCDMTYVSLPASFTNISSTTFDTCNAFKTIKVGWTTPPSDFDIFSSFEDKSQCKLIVPEGTKEAYATSTYWKDYQIEEDEKSGISDVVVDSASIIDEYGNARANIYSMDGILVIKAGQKTSDLPMGVYITNNKKFVQKH